jgi:hypothetical protein
MTGRKRLRIQQVEQFPASRTEASGGNVLEGEYAMLTLDRRTMLAGMTPATAAAPPTMTESLETRRTARGEPPRDRSPRV